MVKTTLNKADTSPKICCFFHTELQLDTRHGHDKSIRFMSHIHLGKKCLEKTRPLKKEDDRINLLSVTFKVGKS